MFAAGHGAVGTIVDLLLQHDDANDPTSTEAALSAAAIAESASVDEALTERVTKHLQTRLESENPLIAIEAGLAMSVLASSAPRVVGAAAAGLVGHDQPWTRLAAICVSLACGTEYLERE